MSRAEPSQRRSPAASLAAELALGLLDGPERVAAEARAADEPEFAAEAADWSARLHPLSEEAASVEPSPRLWDRIAATPPAARAGEPAGAQPRTAEPEPSETPAPAPAGEGGKLEPAPDHQEKHWRRLAGLATALAAACVVALVVLLGRHPVAPPPLLSARLDPPGGAMVLSGASLYTVTLDRGRSSVVLTPVSPGPVDPRARELWLTPKGGRPMAAGVLDGRRVAPLHLSRELVAAARDGALLTVSLEPAGGSKTGAPTGPVIASGVLARI